MARLPRIPNTPHGPATTSLPGRVLDAVEVVVVVGVIANLTPDWPGIAGIALLAAAVVAAQGWRDRFTATRQAALQLVDQEQVEHRFTGPDDHAGFWLVALRTDAGADRDPRPLVTDDDFAWLLAHDLIAPTIDDQYVQPVVLTGEGTDALIELGLDAEQVSQ